MSQSNIYNEDLPTSLQVKKRISNKVRISFPKGHSSLDVTENKPCYFKSKFERDNKFKDIATLGGRLKDWSSCHFLTRDQLHELNDSQLEHFQLLKQEKLKIDKKIRYAN